jgi:hypothetical protein
VWEVRTDLRINSYLVSVNYELKKIMLRLLEIAIAAIKKLDSKKISQDGQMGIPVKCVLKTQKNNKLKFLPILVVQYLVNWSVSWNGKFSQLGFGAPRVSKINVSSLVADGQHWTTWLPVNTSCVDFRLEYH